MATRTTRTKGTHVESAPLAEPAPVEPKATRKTRTKGALAEAAPVVEPARVDAAPVVEPARVDAAPTRVAASAQVEVSAPETSAAGSAGSAPPPVAASPTDGPLRPVRTTPARLGMFSAAAGVAKFVPIPLADTVVLNQIESRMIAELLGSPGLEVPDHVVRRLIVPTPPSLAAPLAAVLQLAALRPLRRVVGRAMFVVALEPALETALRVFEAGYLIRHAVMTGRVTPEGLGRDAHAVERLRRALAESRGPSRFGVWARLGRPIGRAVKETWEATRAQGPSALPGTLVASLAGALLGEAGYLAELRATFERAWAE